MTEYQIPPTDPNSPHYLPLGWTLHDASYYGHTYARAPDGTTWHREEGRFIKPRQEWDRVNLDGVRSL